jgi:hypothetical protein
MVFIVIPPTDVDVGSPVDEKLMDTIRIDLDDLDSRVTTNTTAIGAVGSGGGGGGGFSNSIYFDAPGTWTSPATVSSSQVRWRGASGGGLGGGAGSFGGGLGGPGGASTASSFMGIISPAQTAGPAKVLNGSSFNYLIDSGARSDSLGIDLATGGSGAGGGAGAGPGTAGGTGGVGQSSYSRVTETVVLASTVYPITIGQGGLGGSGGGGYNVSPGANGAAGGLIPYYSGSSVGPTGAVGGNAVGAGAGGGGGGGGGGTNGYAINYFND